MLLHSQMGSHMIRYNNIDIYSLFYTSLGRRLVCSKNRNKLFFGFCTFILSVIFYCQVIMSQGTHLYFDHPYEPDPEERGLYWACRFLDTRKAFMFMPDNIYGNADVKLTGEAVPEDYIEKHREDHDKLIKTENVIGKTAVSLILANEAQ